MATTTKETVKKPAAAKASAKVSATTAKARLRDQYNNEIAAALQADLGLKNPSPGAPPRKDRHQCRPWPC